MDEVLQSFFHDDIVRINDMIASYNSNQQSYSKHTLVNFIVNNDLYKDYYTSVCDSLFKKVFGKDVPHTMTTFMESYHKNITLVNQCFEKQVLQDNLKQSNEFKNHFVRLIEELYHHYTDTYICKTHTELVLDKLKSIDFNDVTLCIDQELQTYIKEHIHHGNANMGNETECEDPLTISFNERYVKAFQTNTPPSTSEFLEYKTFSETPELVMDAYLQIKNSSYDPLFTIKTNTFLELFDREMTVFEYKMFSNLDFVNCDIKTCITEYHAIFNEKYKVATNLYRLYFDDQLDHHIFCRSFLDYVNCSQDEFCRNVINCMIQTDKYINVMNLKIASIYKKNYETVISEIDSVYFFSEIIKKKLHLEDEELPQTISQLKNQTDEHLNTLNNVFQKVLQRDADVFEKDQYIYYFRDGYDMSGNKQVSDSRYKASLLIEHELYESMEYQDVLKDWLKESLQMKNHSILYKIMLYITKLDETELIRNKTVLLEKLKKEFQQYF